MSAATLHRLIKEAVDSRDPEKLGRISEHMRLDLGFRYTEQFEQAAIACPGITLPEWDGLLYEADEAGH